MCVCNAMVKTPWCGKPGCERPEQRPHLDVYFLSIALAVSQRSTWKGTKVGCVVVQDKQIVSTGYNGAPARYRNDLDRSEKRKFCHAEENAIVQAAKHGSRLSGATFYTLLSPCLTCARMMVNAGASEVVFGRLWDEADEAGEAICLMRDCGIIVRLARTEG